MKRSLVADCLELIGKEVRIAGWVQTVRSHGKIAFFDLRDRSGTLQVGAFDPSIVEAVSKLNPQDVVEVRGVVKKRDMRFVNKEMMLGTIEVEASFVSLLVASSAMPFDMGGKDLILALPTLFDYRSLTLKHPKQIAIFKAQAALASGFRKAALDLGCTEIFVPTIVASATEGGAEVFEVKYYDHKAYLAQSPQLYKQIMVGVFERVFAFSHAYRAEPSVTTRHLSEVVQLDIEMGFIEDFSDLLNALEFVGTTIVKEAALEGVYEPLIPKKVPRLKLREAQKIIKNRTGRDLSKEEDLNPEDEKEICEWAALEHKSDFVTITHFPTMKKPFYTHPDPSDPTYSLSYDLLFRGIEISSGSQRINKYDELVEAMKKRGMDIESFGIYLQAFKFGMPPEGGFSFGLERLTMKLFDLANVREASLFPRDMERIDERFSKTTSEEDILV